MKNNIILFFSEYLKNVNLASEAYSPAGCQAQAEILNQLSKNTFLQQQGYRIINIAHAPFPLWPHGPAFVNLSSTQKNTVLTPYLNVFPFRSVIRASHIIYFCLKYNPVVIIIYNTTLLQSLALLVVQRLFKVKIAAVIQDIVLPPTRRPEDIVIRRANIFAIKLTRFFNLLIPISNQISLDFALPAQKTFTFHGGVTRQTRDILQLSSKLSYQDLKKRAVFAGTLEPYNGVDVLVNAWIHERIPFKLYIFGQGTLKEKVTDLCAKSNGNVVYMGNKQESVVSEWIATSMFNICLRYPLGIHETYFFPSKLFNLLAARGSLICNDFANLPVAIKDKSYVYTDSFLQTINSSLATPLPVLEKNYLARKDILKQCHDWSTAISIIVDRLIGPRN